MELNNNKNKLEDQNSLNNYITPIDKEKIPKKKFNFKELFYRKRIKYGKYIEMGLVSDKVKFCVKNGNIIYQIDEKGEEKNEDKNDINNKYLKALYYCSELDFSNMPSKREIKLRKMLDERIEKYRAIINKNKKDKDHNKNNNNNINNDIKDKD